MIGLLCVGALTVAQPWVPIRERCRAPFDGVLWTLEGDEDREAMILDLLADQASRRCDLALRKAELAILESQAALAAARFELDVAPVAEPASWGWAWTVAGLAAPVAGWGACKLSGADGALWCGVGAGAGALGFSLMMTW